MNPGVASIAALTVLSLLLLGLLVLMLLVLRKKHLQMTRYCTSITPGLTICFMGTLNVFHGDS